MYILRPVVVIHKAGFIRRFFSLNWHCYLTFAVEIERYNYRSSMTCNHGRKSFYDLQSALLHAEHLKTRIDGTVTESYYLD